MSMTMLQFTNSNTRSKMSGDTMLLSVGSRNVLEGTGIVNARPGLQLGPLAADN
jgi:hypothetical protein